MGPSWEQMQPGWYESSGTANIGSGLLALRFCRVGTVLHLAFLMQVAPNTETGQGGWGFDVPFLLPPDAFSEGGRPDGGRRIPSEWTLPARAWDQSAKRMWTGAARISPRVPPGSMTIQDFPPSAYYMDFFVGDNGDRVGAGKPFVWAQGDILSASGSVEAFGN